MKVTAAYFSPTGGTKKYTEAIAGSLDENFMTVDLTRAENRRKSFSFSPDDVVILGAPVYAGRLSIVEEGLFQNLKGQGTRTILVVTYGNRDFDDALLELKNLCIEKEFVPAAAGRFWQNILIQKNLQEAGLPRRIWQKPRLSALK